MNADASTHYSSAGTTRPLEVFMGDQTLLSIPSCERYLSPRGDRLVVGSGGGGVETNAATGALAALTAAEVTTRLQATPGVTPAPAF